MKRLLLFHSPPHVLTMFSHLNNSNAISLSLCSESQMKATASASAISISISNRIGTTLLVGWLVADRVLHRVAEENNQRKSSRHDDFPLDWYSWWHATMACWISRATFRIWWWHTRMSTRLFLLWITLHGSSTTVSLPWQSFDMIVGKRNWLQLRYNWGACFSYQYCSYEDSNLIAGYIASKLVPPSVSSPPRTWRNGEDTGWIYFPLYKLKVPGAGRCFGQMPDSIANFVSNLKLLCPIRIQKYDDRTDELDVSYWSTIYGPDGLVWCFLRLASFLFLLIFTNAWRSSTIGRLGCWCALYYLSTGVGSSRDGNAESLAVKAFDRRILQGYVGWLGEALGLAKACLDTEQ